MSGGGNFSRENAIKNARRKEQTEIEEIAPAAGTRSGVCGLWIQMAGLSIARVSVIIIEKPAIQTRREGGEHGKN